MKTQLNQKTFPMTSKKCTHQLLGQGHGKGWGRTIGSGCLASGCTRRARPIRAGYKDLGRDRVTALQLGHRRANPLACFPQFILRDIAKRHPQKG